MLKVENISTGYGKKQVLFDVSFEMKEGEIVLLTGANGSGKSTVLRTIYRLLPLWNGEISFKDIKLSRLSTVDMLKNRIAFIQQQNFYFESLTVKKNIEISGSLFNKKELDERMGKVWRLPKLYDYRNRVPFDLSGGERKLLALGMVLIHDPKLILFDEPFAGVDQKHHNIIMEELIKINDNNVAILIVEHRSNNLLSVTKHIKIMHGKTVI
jgi:branched-chain amino acid transport system ATP-binding protein